MCSRVNSRGSPVGEPPSNCGLSLNLARHICSSIVIHREYSRSLIADCCNIHLFCRSLKATNWNLSCQRPGQFTNATLANHLLIESIGDYRPRTVNRDSKVSLDSDTRPKCIELTSLNGPNPIRSVTRKATSIVAAFTVMPTGVSSPLGALSGGAVYSR